MSSMVRTIQRYILAKKDPKLRKSVAKLRKVVRAKKRTPAPLHPVMHAPDPNYRKKRGRRTAEERRARKR